ncbi:MAG: hypothetical protein IH586_02135 [Anaerolineaceae bacterium]|nr:hypothetical protein [Anaerolineaceae bacterium]
MTVISKNLAHIYWVGGSPCSGKSSIATALAAKYGWEYYSCDDAFYRHWKMVNAEDQPVFTRVMRLDQEVLWMRPVEQQVREEIEIYREEFPFILADLQALPRTRPVIAEGAALMPELVLSYLTQKERYIAIVPAAAFQLEHYSRREWITEHLNACSDPQQAFRNWMERDIRFAIQVRARAEESGLRTIVVDGERTIDEIRADVERYFGCILT